MFNRDNFVADCLAAVKETDNHKAVCELVLRAISDAEAIIAELGEPRQAAVEVLHASDELTILNGVSGPWMTVPPHDHRMWAVIGVWRRIPSAVGGLIEAAGARSISAGEAHPMGRDIIHTFTNPLTRLTGALHVYGGNLLHVPRSEWDHETLQERPLDPDYLRRLIQTSNRFIGNSHPPC